MIDVTINGEQVSSMYLVTIVFVVLPWIYGVVMLISDLVDSVITPILYYIRKRILRKLENQDANNE